MHYFAFKGLDDYTSPMNFDRYAELSKSPTLTFSRDTAFKGVILHHTTFECYHEILRVGCNQQEESVVIIWGIG